ncbi:MAG: glycoside hydrolase family 28 protein [Lachnospiraceae bacterium]|nr:glycoside hydrolase family 28 protein [Lachnospiraceae bacterium]
MEFRFAAVFNRSLVVELDSDTVYRLDEPVEVLIKETGDSAKERNHRSKACPVTARTFRTVKNVFSIDSLAPGTDYAVSVREENGETVTKEITTKPESVLLDVRAFGAAGDGVKDDTAAIQAAIMACPPGGTVWLPAGTWSVTPLFLKSRMTLWLDEGAVLLGNTDRTKYPVLPGMTRATNEAEEYNLASWEGNPLDAFASLLTGISVQEIDVIGAGTIDGNAQNADWWVDHRTKRIAWRPNTVYFAYCRQIRMQGVTVRNSPSWTIHPYYSDDLGFYDLTIRNPSDSPNTDGLDPESCERVEILGTLISVGDDCMAIKSGKIYMSRVHLRPTREITVRNCRLERGHGSVTIGSEIASGVTDVHVSQCEFDGTDRGLRIKTRRGRGQTSALNNICFENIRMNDVMMPFTLNMFYFCDPDGHTDYVQDQQPHPVDEMTPSIGRIEAKNIECTGVHASLVCAMGLPESPIDELVIENIRAQFAPKASRRTERPVMMDNFDPVSGKSVIARNVRRLVMKDVTIAGEDVAEPEIDGVEEAETEGLIFE